jgi:hypothetical protein
MTFRRALVAGTIALLAAVTLTVSAARADQAYTVDGHDQFRIGSGEVQSRTIYRGTQQLTIARDAGGTHYVARVEYDKLGDGVKQHERASFVATLLPSGDQRDGPAHDPDYLTVLNQPFAVQLDMPTMRDLAHVTRAVPFDFPSPMTGAPLHGTLRRLPDAMLGNRRVMGIAFDASGPLHGAPPSQPTMSLAGAITMKGTAYYAYDTALLLALDATLAIEGNLDDATRHAPVSIVYARSIRSSNGAQTARLTPVPMPKPT